MCYFSIITLHGPKVSVPWASFSYLIKTHFILALYNNFGRWMAKFKAHLREGIDMLKRGQAIHTRVGGRGAAAAKKKPGADKKSYTGKHL